MIHNGEWGGVTVLYGDVFVPAMVDTLKSYEKKYVRVYRWGCDTSMEVVIQGVSSIGNDERVLIELDYYGCVGLDMCWFSSFVMGYADKGKEYDVLVFLKDKDHLVELERMSVMNWIDVNELLYNQELVDK